MHPRIRSRAHRALGIGLVVVASCESRPPASQEGFSSPELAHVVLDGAFHHWRNAMAAIDPSVTAGDTARDAALAPLTPETIRRSLELLDRARQDLERVERSPLTPDAKASLALLRARIDADEADLAVLRRPERDASFAPAVVRRSLRALDRETQEPALRARLEAVPAYLEGSRDILQFPWRIHTEIAIQETDALLADLDAMIPPSATAGDHETPPFDAAVAAAHGAAEQHAKWLRFHLANSTQGHHGIGREAFEKLLASESGLEITCDRVAELGESEIDAAQRRLEAAAHSLRPDGTVDDALATLESDRAEDAAQLDALARGAIDEAAAFVRTTRFATLPSGLRLQAAIAPRVDPIGGLAVLDFRRDGRGTASDAVFRVSPPASELSRIRIAEWYGALAPARMRLIALDQTVPGRALEEAVRAACPDRIRRTASVAGFTEGWPAYARRAAVAAGFGKDDARIALADASADLVLGARAVAAARIHEGRMTIAEAVNLFRDRAHLPADLAEREARLCAADPLRALAVVGRRELEQIAGAMQERKGSRGAAHDAILAAGALPFPALRAWLD